MARCRKGILGAMAALSAVMLAHAALGQDSPANMFGGDIMRPAPVGRTVRYGEADQETVRIYRGRGSRSAPVVLLFDGSDASSRHYNYILDELIHGLMDSGIAVISVKGQSNTLENEAASTKRALVFSKGLAEKERFDFGRTGIIGYGYGSQIAALVATDPSFLEAAHIPFATLRTAAFIDSDPVRASEFSPEALRALPTGSYLAGDPAVVERLAIAAHLPAPNVPQAFFANFRNAAARALAANELADQLRASGVEVKVHMMMSGDGSGAGIPDRRSFRLIREYLVKALK